MQFVGVSMSGWNFELCGWIRLSSAWLTDFSSRDCGLSRRGPCPGLISLKNVVHAFHKSVTLRLFRDGEIPLFKVKFLINCWWRFGLVVTCWCRSVSYTTWARLVLGWVTTGKPSRYVTSHPGQLSLVIPPWVVVTSTSKSWGVNGHTARYTRPVFVVSQCKLVSGWGMWKQRSAPPHKPCGSGRTLFTLFTFMINYYPFEWCCI